MPRGPTLCSVTRAAFVADLLPVAQRRGTTCAVNSARVEHHTNAASGRVNRPTFYKACTPTERKRPHGCDARGAFFVYRNAGYCAAALVVMRMTPWAARGSLG
jgi:hypothetical protein